MEEYDPPEPELKVVFSGTPGEYLTWVPPENMKTEVFVIVVEVKVRDDNTTYQT